jgi:hypothetical protein
VTAVETRPLGSDLEPGDDEPHHVVCCRDENLALCGTDVTDDAWRSDEVPPSCVVCDDLLRNPSFCPLLGWCPEYDV